MSRIGMTKTELQLLAVHHAPVAMLADICDKYLGINYQTARLKAAKHGLPFAVFQADPENTKTPWMVRIEDLATFIDAMGKSSVEDWAHSQV